jgi:hypothetical protein
VFEIIKNDALLRNFIVEECCENDVCVRLDENIPPENFVIIKVDDYYNSLGLGETPASVDCLIIRKCLISDYGLTLVELKNIRFQKRLDIENLKSKFETCLKDFIQQRFRVIYNANYKDIKLYFVSNIKNYKRDIGLMTEILINTKFEFHGKKLMIIPVAPHPTIKNCN